MEVAGLLALGAVVYLLASAAQAITGFGMALLAVPVLIPVVGPVPAVVSSVLVSVVLCARAWWRERDEVDVRLAMRVSVAAAFGLPLGLVLLLLLTEVQLSLAVAVSVVLGVLVLALVKLPPVGRVGEVVGGFVSGALLTSTGLNGPPLVITFQAAGLEPRRFRATLQAAFLAQDVVAVIGFLVVAKIDLTAGLVALGGIAGVPAGWALGDKVFGALRPETFRKVVLAGLVMTACASVALVLR